MTNFTLFKRLLFLKIFLLMTFNLHAATLEVSPSQINAGSKFTEGVIQITSDIDWDYTRSDSWIYMYTSWSNGNATMTYQITENTSASPRTGTITFTGPGAVTKVVTITQAGLSADSYEANDDEASAYQVSNYVYNNAVASFQLNGTFHTTTDVDYYKLVLPAGYKYNITTESEYDPNYASIMVDKSMKVGEGLWSSTTSYPLEALSDAGTVYLKLEPYYSGSKGAYSINVHVTRIPENASLEVSKDILYLNSDGSPVNFNIISNTSWTLMSYEGWLAFSSEFGSNGKTITVSADANPNKTIRSGYITASASGVINKIINVVQYGKDIPDDRFEKNNTEAEARELSATFNGSSCDLKTTGLNISSANDTDFFKIHLPAGVSYGFYANTYAKNSGEYFYIKYKVGNNGAWNTGLGSNTNYFSLNGEGDVYFKIFKPAYNDPGEYGFDVFINKLENAQTFSVSTSNLSLGADENSTVTFNVTSNSNWKIINSESWLKVEPASGSGNATVTVTAQVNASVYTRSSYLSVICPVVGSRSISIAQMSGGTVSPDSYEVNDTESGASEFSLNFVNDKAFFKTNGANIHSATDVDYFKISLPQGYKYKIASRLQDSFNHSDNETYSLDAKYSYKTPESGWSYETDTEMEDYSFTGGDLYFKVSSFYNGRKGNYALQFEITRASESSSLIVSNYSLSLQHENLSTGNFAITSQGTIWSIVSSEPWLTTNFTTGTDNAKIIVTALENHTSSYRYATLTISANGMPDFIMYVYQEGKDFIPDKFEENNTENTASSLNLSFTNNEAVFVGNDLNIHTEDDKDYFKMSLDDGYCYTVTALTSTSKISYKAGASGSWNTTYNHSTPEIYLSGQQDVYFKLESSYKDVYFLNFKVQREPFTLLSSAANLAFDDISGSVSVDISSNIDWVAISSQNWLTVSNESGSKNGTITVTAANNLFAAERTATVTLKGGGITKTITVTQAAADPYLTVNSNTMNVGSAANSTNKFLITSNTNWTVTSSQPWLTFNKNSGAADGVITATAESNTAQTIRTAQITVSGSGLNRVITVTQNGAGTDPTLTVSASTLQVNSTENSTAAFSIASNATWKVTSLGNWLRANNTTGTGNANITLTAVANPTVQSRTAEVTVTVPGISRLITVTQLPGDSVLTVSSGTLTINDLTNSFATFDIRSNIPWTVSSSQSWLVLNTGSGTGDATLMAKAAVNEDAESRTAIITVNGNTVRRTITVTQKAATSTLDVFENSFILSANANSNARFNIISNARWTVTTSESWLTVDKGNGSDNSMVIVTAAANTNVASRTATILIAVDGKSHQINVTQAGITTGTEDALNAEPQFYPNPVVDKLRIEYPGEKMQKNVKIYSENGELRLDKNTEENVFVTDMSGYQAGVYFIRITTENGTRIFKVIKQ